MTSRLNTEETDHIHDENVKRDPTIAHRLIEGGAERGKHAKDSGEIKGGGVNYVGGYNYSWKNRSSLSLPKRR
jgi:hypothetical protein